MRADQADQYAEVMEQLWSRARRMGRNYRVIVANALETIVGLDDDAIRRLEDGPIADLVELARRKEQTMQSQTPQQRPKPSGPFCVEKGTPPPPKGNAIVAALRSLGVFGTPEATFLRVVPEDRGDVKHASVKAAVAKLRREEKLNLRSYYDHLGNLIVVRDEGEAVIAKRGKAGG